MTMDYNIRNSKHKKIRDIGYQKYDNYNAIDVPFIDAIPKDYDGDMGVPITFLNKHNPAQFEIVKFRHGDDGKDLLITIDGQVKTPYTRILIRRKTGL